MSVLVGSGSALRLILRTPIRLASARYNSTNAASTPSTSASPSASESASSPSASSSSPFSSGGSTSTATNDGTSGGTTATSGSTSSRASASASRTAGGRIWPNIRINLPSEALELVKPSHSRAEAWWQAASHIRQAGKVGHTYSGRTFPVRRVADLSREIKNLLMLMRRSGVSRLLKNEEYHEKPSDKRQRLASERHRRRFAALVREKVHQVQLLQNRAK